MDRGENVFGASKMEGQVTKLSSVAMVKLRIYLRMKMLLKCKYNIWPIGWEGTLSIAMGKSSKYYFYKYFDYRDDFAVLCINQVQSCQDGIGDVA